MDRSKWLSHSHRRNQRKSKNPHSQNEMYEHHSPHAQPKKKRTPKKTKTLQPTLTLRYAQGWHSRGSIMASSQATSIIRVDGLLFSAFSACIQSSTYLDWVLAASISAHLFLLGRMGWTLWLTSRYSPGQMQSTLQLALTLACTSASRALQNNRFRP